MLFQEPSTSRFDLNFSVVGIPVRVHPLFWVTTVFFGTTTGDLDRLLVWIGVVFLSILLHELGHALLMRRYGQPAHIVLYAWGGLAVPEVVPWGRGWAGVATSPRQEVWVSLAGPGTGFFFAGLTLALALLVGADFQPTVLGHVMPWINVLMPFGGRIVNLVVSTILYVNLGWGLINLMPVYPLDGGQVARNLWIVSDPLEGGRRSLWLSVIAGVIGVLGALAALGSTGTACLFALLAMQSLLTLFGREKKSLF